VALHRLENKLLLVKKKGMLTLSSLHNSMRIAKTLEALNQNRLIIF
jgi:hypothetical protein